jgi:hypothetical protein
LHIEITNILSIIQFINSVVLVRNDDEAFKGATLKGCEIRFRLNRFEIPCKLDGMSDIIRKNKTQISNKFRYCL